MPTRHDLDLDVMPPSCIGEHLLALLVRSFSTTSRPPCGRPPAGRRATEARRAHPPTALATQAISRWRIRSGAACVVKRVKVRVRLNVDHAVGDNGRAVDRHAEIWAILLAAFTLIQLSLCGLLFGRVVEEG